MKGKDVRVRVCGDKTTKYLMKQLDLPTFATNIHLNTGNISEYLIPY